MPFDFSVVVPCFNTPAPFLERVLISVVNAADSGVRVQIVLVDDGSEVGIFRNGDKLFRQILRPHIEYSTITHTTNLGLAAARNSGMAAAKGNYVVFLDSDDWLLPGSLTDLKLHLDSHPADVTYSLTALAGDRSNLLPDKIAPSDIAIKKAFERGGNSRITPSNLPELALAMSSWSQVYSLNFLHRSGLVFDPELRRWEDRPFVVQSQLLADSIGIYPHLFRAYFVGNRDKNLPSITRRKFDVSDLHMMYRHIRTIDRLQNSKHGLTGSSFANRHYWMSVQRYLSVMGGAVLPILLSNSKARRLCLGTARWLWERRPETGIEGVEVPELTLMLWRRTLLELFQRANNWTGALPLVAIFGSVAQYRRIRAILR